MKDAELHPDRWRRALFTWSISVLAVLWSSGCGTRQHTLMGLAVDLDAPMRTIDTAPFAGRKQLPVVAVSVVFQAPEQDEALTEEETADEATGERESLPFAPTALTATLAQSISTLGIFEGVVPLSTRGHDLGPLLLRERAAARGASFVLQLVIADARLYDEGAEMLFGTILWAVAAFGSAWYSNHTFDLSYDVRLRLYDVNSELVLEKPLGRAGFRDTLSFVERTSSIWAFLASNLIPSPVLWIDEYKVARSLTPYALLEPCTKLISYLDETTSGKRYVFQISGRKDPELPVEVLYPRGGRRYVLIGDSVRLQVRAQANNRRNLRAAWFNQKKIWPVASPLKRPRRKILVLDTIVPISPGRAFKLEVEDTSGRRQNRQLFPISSEGRVSSPYHGCLDPQAVCELRAGVETAACGSKRAKPRTRRGGARGRCALRPTSR
ncbi:hypothetical protein ACFL59_07060, partial [Planctomycetota bacterium]